MPVTFKDIRVGQKYSRPLLADLWGYKRYQALARGVVTQKNDTHIILFVTEGKQSFQVQYEDHLSGNILEWEGPTDHFAEERMINAHNTSDEIHVFHRDQHHKDFFYLGQALVLNVEKREGRPSKFILNVGPIGKNWRSLPNLDKDCFGCGSENLSGLRMTFETNGEQIRTKLTVSPQFRGWSKLIHGGVISTILDETMSWAAIILTKRFILTKQMTIEFLRPVYVGSSLIAIGSIKEQTGDRNAIAQAELFDDQGKLCARSEGEFVLFSKEQFSRLNILPEEDLMAMAATFE